VDNRCQVLFNTKLENLKQVTMKDTQLFV